MIEYKREFRCEWCAVRSAAALLEASSRIRRSSAGWGISRESFLDAPPCLRARSFPPPEKRLRSGWRP